MYLALWLRPCPLKVVVVVVPVPEKNPAQSLNGPVFAGAVVVGGFAAAPPTAPPG